MRFEEEKIHRKKSLSGGKDSYIYNASTGNTDNAGGRIENDGTFESVQTPEEMGGTIDGPVELIGSNYSGGGCNAGFGTVGFFLAGFVALKRRKA